jgi:hypothetical protein
MYKRNDLFLAALFITLMAGFWFYGTYDFIKKTDRGNSVVQTKDTFRIEKKPPTKAVTQTTEQTTVASENRNSTPEINAKLELERQKLELQKQNLEALRVHQNAQLQQTTTVYPTQITSNNLQIENLIDSQRNQRMAESDVNTAAAAALIEQTSQDRLARDQIDQTISDLETAIQQTKNAIGLGVDPTYALTSAEQDRMANLQNQLLQQISQLNLLKDQRLNISAGTLIQTRTISNLSQAQKADLISTQNTLQDQISNLRAENSRLQLEFNQTRMSLMPLSQQIDQAERAYQDQVLKVQNLEQSSVVR